MTTRTKRSVLAYLVSVMAVLAVLALLHPTATAFGVYYSISFWLVVAVDASCTKLDKTSANGFPFEDRLIGYIFVAPFIWPARLQQLAVTNSSL